MSLMTMPTKLLCTFAALLLCCVANAAVTGEWVSFEDAANPPTAVQARLAAERGVELKPKTSPTYWGRLHRPEGKGRFPAIVFVETCWGPMRDKTSIYEPWIETLSSWGYVILRISRCTPDIDETADRMAYPLRWNSLVFVTYGAFSALSAVNEAGAQQLFPQKFRVAVAFYPYCRGDSGPFIAPTMILVGAKDDWTLSRHCQGMAAENGSPIEVKVYPDAFHGFDLAGMGNVSFYKKVFNLEKNPARDATAGYNGTAHQSALRKVEAFLNEHLASKLPE